MTKISQQSKVSYKNGTQNLSKNKLESICEAIVLDTILQALFWHFWNMHLNGVIWTHVGHIRSK